MGPEKLVPIFDAATKVTSPLALAAFGIAALVTIVLAWLSFRARQTESQQHDLPALARTDGDAAAYDDAYAYGPGPTPPPPNRSSFLTIVLIVLAIFVLVPVAAWAFVTNHSDLPYIARVLSVDQNLGLIKDADVISSVNGSKSTFDGGTQFEIPPSSLPADKSVGFYATTETSRGNKTVIFQKARSVSVTIDLVPKPKIVPTTVPAPIRTPHPPKAHSPKPPIDGIWMGTYVSERNVPQDIVSIYQVIIDKDRFIAKEHRTQAGETICNAEWTGTADMTTDAQVLVFTASRKHETGYFCNSYTTPVDIEGTVTRSSYNEIKVNIPADVRWGNVVLKR